MGKLNAWIFLALVYLIVIIAPSYFFFGIRGGLAYLENLNARTFAANIFPLVGLYAFCLVWAQIIVGSNMRFIRQKIMGVEVFHRKVGVLTFIFALLHPTLLFLSVGPAAYFTFKYVDKNLIRFVISGYFALFLIIVTVISALLRKRAFLVGRWHYIHLLNYLIFFLVWTHSWFLGTDVRSTGLKNLWILFALTVILSTVFRWYHLIAKVKIYRRYPAPF